MIKQNKLSLIALHKEIEALKTQSTPSNKTKINSVLVEGTTPITPLTQPEPILRK